MSNYSATVVKLSTVNKHPNANKLGCVSLYGNNVIVGLDTKEGDIGLFFPPESQIGLEFAKANNLIRYKDTEGKVGGGLFDENRRVRCQTLRGEKSMGFFCPLAYLSKLNPNATLPNVGEEIETWSGFDISKKYVSPNIQASTSTVKQDKSVKNTESRIIDGQFSFHLDTSHLAKNLHKFEPDSLIAVTWKVHGTSFITSNCLVKKPLKWYERMLQKIGVNIVNTEYDYLYSSRKVIKNSGMQTNYGNATGDLWVNVGKSFRGKLHKGETIYGEICGYLKDSTFIQKPFDYGCDVGQNKVYVYRITQTNIDGLVTELSWPQVKERCEHIGVEHVPEIYYGFAGDMSPDILVSDSDFFRDSFFNYIKENYVYDQDCHICENKAPAEGVVVRQEGLKIENYKIKSFRFLQYETKQLDTGEVDTETTQTGG